MKSIMRRIDTFCAKHPNFGIPNLMMIIVFGNVAVYILELMNTSSASFSSFLAFNAAAIMRGQVWRLLTFVFVPSGGSLISFAISLYFYYFIGNTLEGIWGSGKFTIYYAVGMLMNVIYGLVVYLTMGRNIGISAYYLNLSMFFAFATFYPDMRVLLLFFIPVKVKWLAWVDAALFAVGVVTNPFPMNLLPIVAVFNYLLFCGGWLFDIIRPSRIRNKASQTARTVNFKQAARRARKEQEGKPYHRKCSVCGKTDVSHPNLEFRYCSRCQGYHCFCEEHINNHIHFTE